MTNIHLLIVDDEPEAGEILALRLSRQGITSHFVTEGQEALDYLAKNKVDVMLLDMKMPGMSGLDVLKATKELYPQTAVIIISGHAHMESAAQGLELGALFYLLKPIDFEVLCHKIEDSVIQAKLLHT